MKSDDPRQRLLGTWKLIAAVREEIPSGTKQKRIARFEGSRVYLSTPPSPDPLTGAISTRTMTWEKVT